MQALTSSPPPLNTVISTNNGASRGASSNSTTPNTSAAVLHAVILSAYDLPVRDAPSYISVELVNTESGTPNTTASTGPPVQRHKDRNAFKFTTHKKQLQAQQSNKIELQATHLQDLYESELVLTVVYQDSPDKNLKTQPFPIRQLIVHETKWLVLALEPSHPNSNNHEDSRTTTNTNNTLNGTTDSQSEDDTWTDAQGMQPTLRLHLTLKGPYRPEVATLVNLASQWCGLVDKIQDSLPKISLPDPKYILIPAAPVLAVAVVSLPVVLGIFVLGLPMFLPLLVALATVFGIAGVALLALYASTRTGRKLLVSWCQPLAHTILSTPSGQLLIYPTGPRPTPVLVTRALLPSHDNLWGRLVVSLLLDGIGSASYLLPLVGEGLDVVWAPLQTVLVAALYNDTVSNKLAYLSFVEEILPLTDIVPTATLGWCMEFALPLVLSQVRGGGETKPMMVPVPPPMVK